MSGRLDKRHALVIGAGSVNVEAPGWSQCQPTLDSGSVGEATTVTYAPAGAIVTCVDQHLAAAEVTPR